MSTFNHTDTAGSGQGAVFTDVTVPDGQLDAAIGNLTTLTTTVKTSAVAAINEVDADLAAVVGGATVTDARLKEWTSGEDYELTAITRNADGVVTTATVKWPDGSAGTFTATTINATWKGIDAYTITHTVASKTVSQASVTRNASGAVTTKPALTVA